MDDLIENSSMILSERLGRLAEPPDPVPLPSNLSRYCRSIVKIILCAPGNYLGTTGLVFAGYGDQDIFPAMIEYQSCGLISSAHIATEIKTAEVTHSIPASVSGFAQTSMIETFQMGISREVYVDVAKAIDEGVDALRISVERALGSAQTIKKAIAKAGFDEIFTQASFDTKENVLDRAFSQNAAPLRNVLSSLPIEEMAELAESLISLQSLKEKVTKPSETVGGPVDVAIITKAEGLVWIKRKHYFNNELNSRFAHRQMREHR